MNQVYLFNGVFDKELTIIVNTSSSSSGGEASEEQKFEWPTKNAHPGRPHALLEKLGFYDLKDDLLPNEDYFKEITFEEESKLFKVTGKFYLSLFQLSTSILLN
jgi:hypothetical protein